MLNIIAIICLAGSYLSVYISPANYWAPAFLGLAFSYFLFANILAILFWLIFKPLYALPSLLLIALGYGHVANYYQFSGKETENYGIDVVSYNVQGFFGGNSKKTVKQNVLQVVKYLEQFEADVICMQEASYAGRIYGDWKEEFEGYNLPKYGLSKGGQVIMSNYPFINSKKQDFEGTGNNFIYADVLKGADTIRIYNCHLQSYAFTRNDIGLIDSIGVESQTELLKDAELYVNKLKRGFIKRAEQVDALRKSIETSPYPVIVCGDFNDTPVSYTYQEVKGANLNDAFVESGNHLGGTYHGKLPSFRIDYIFHGDQFKSYNFKTEHVDYSDHFPIKCRLIQEN